MENKRDVVHSVILILLERRTNQTPSGYTGDDNDVVIIIEEEGERFHRIKLTI